MVCPVSWRGMRAKDGRHTSVSPPYLARHWVLCALCAAAVPGDRMALRDAAPSLPHKQGPPFSLCTSVRAMVSTLPILISGLVLPYLSLPLSSTACRWHQPLGIGTVEGHQGCHVQVGEITAPNAGHSRPDKSEPPMANCIVDQMNIEIGRPRI